MLKLPTMDSAPAMASAALATACRAPLLQFTSSTGYCTEEARKEEAHRLQADAEAADDGQRPRDGQRRARNC